MHLPRQLALPFPHRPAYAPADFCAAESNEAALAWLARTADWPLRRLALWGAEGRGKTHLLHIWAAAHGAMLLDGLTLAALPALPATGGVALDDADAAPELPLLHLINATAEAGLPLLLTGRTAPARWPVALPDLASRLRATTAVALGAPDDALLRSLLARLLAERQIAVPAAVQDWLLLRLPRSAAAMREAAARLDRLALAAGGAAGRAIAREVVAAMTGNDHDVSETATSAVSPAPNRLI